MICVEWCLTRYPTKIFITDAIRVRLAPYSIHDYPYLYSRTSVFVFVFKVIRIRIRIRLKIWKQIWFHWYPSVFDPITPLVLGISHRSTRSLDLKPIQKTLRKMDWGLCWSPDQSDGTPNRSTRETFAVLDLELGIEPSGGPPNQSSREHCIWSLPAWLRCAHRLCCTITTSFCSWVFMSPSTSDIECLAFPTTWYFIA
jgi:hypothetical protein